MHGTASQHEMLRKSVQYCRSKRRALDVGAHIGICSKILARWFDNVAAFEPVKENFDCLRTNVPETVELHNVALGVAASTCDMTLPDGKVNSGCWRAAPGDSVEIRSVDSFEFTDVDFMKLDVEGFEGHVLAGATELLKAYRPVILFEDNNVGLLYYGKSWVDPKKVIQPLGYRYVTRIHKNEVWAC